MNDNTNHIGLAEGHEGIEMNVTDEILNYTQKISYEDLPQDVIKTTKYRILDTLGTMVAGSSTHGIQKLLKIIRNWGGRPESTLAVHGDRLPAPLAALANCTMARAREMDDVHEKAGTHASAQIIPSAFCIAEYAKAVHGNEIDGKQVIAAIAMGTDIVIRLRKAGREDGPEIGWLGETFTPLAVALMGAKMLSFSRSMTLNALGIGYAQCSCNAQANVDGAFTVSLQQGLGAKAGMIALALAEEGLTGAQDPIEGKYGLYSLYLRGNFSPDVIMNGLGEKFEGMNISTKFFPCCQGNHSAITGALELSSKYEIKIDDIDHIIIRTNTFFKNILASPDKMKPRTSYDAQFSLFYTVARSLLDGGLKIDDFTEEKITEKKVIDVANKIRVESDPGKDALKELVPPVDVDIVMKNNRKYSTKIAFVKGHPKNPGSHTDYINKFDECMKFSAKTLDDEAVKQVKQRIENLELLDDVTDIIQALA